MFALQFSNKGENIAIMSEMRSMLDAFLNQTEQELEFMPIVSLGEDEMNEDEINSLPAEVPLIALRNTVLFPNVVLPITVARDKSIQAIKEAQKTGKWIGVVAQRDAMTTTRTLTIYTEQVRWPRW